MTVKAYLENLRMDYPEKVVQEELEKVSVWSDSAALGYALRAARECGINYDQTVMLIETMGKFMQETPIEAAWRYYNDNPI